LFIPGHAMSRGRRDYTENEISWQIFPDLFPPRAPPPKAALFSPRRRENRAVFAALSIHPIMHNCIIHTQDCRADRICPLKYRRESAIKSQSSALQDFRRAGSGNARARRASRPDPCSPERAHREDIIFLLHNAASSRASYFHER